MPQNMTGRNEKVAAIVLLDGAVEFINSPVAHLNGYNSVMKINSRIWRWYRVKAWAGLAAILVLVLVEFGVVFRFGHNCAGPPQVPGAPDNLQGLGDWLAAH